MKGLVVTFIAIAACLLSLEAAADDGVFRVVQATYDLADGAPVLTRAHHKTLTVHSPGRAHEEIVLVQTAFSAAGREEVGRFGVFHDEFRRVRQFEGTLRDADGRVLRRVRMRDTRDEPIATISLYDGLRYRSAELFSDRLPFTVEWRVEVEHRGLLGWPSWYAQPGGRSLESGALTVVVPVSLGMRYRVQSLSLEPTVTPSARDVRYEWRVAALPQVAAEPFAPDVRDRSPAVFLVGDEFEIGGSRGRLDSWEAFGRWYGELSSGRDELPEDLKREVERITADARSDREKAERLYRYLQESTRYVSVQLGLGGWQPFDAAYVYRRRFGDCKALTNYLMAMLRHAGVPSYPALIYSGSSDPLDENFPDNVFNHVVLYVPLTGHEEGPAWLECTSPFHEFGHLGSSSEGRHALLVTDGGGRLVRTPESRSEVNRTARHFDVQLERDGSATVDAEWRLRGESRAMAASNLTGANTREREAWLRTASGLASGEVQHFDVTSLAQREPEVALRATVAQPRHATRAGARLLVRPWFAVEPLQNFRQGEERREPIIFRYARLEEDSVSLVGPEGFAAESIPEDIEIDTPFARFVRTAEIDSGGRSVQLRRVLEWSATHVDAEYYDSLQTFFERVTRADAERVVFAPTP